LLSYARRIIELHDEAAVTLGSTAAAASVRMGLPQDFFEDVMPEAIARFSHHRAGIHVEVRAGRNYALEDEVNAGHLDMALVFFRHGRPVLAEQSFTNVADTAVSGLPLVLFDHPCLFRQSALHTLDREGVRWRQALTTPSLPGVWGALRFGQGVSVRTAHRVPEGIHDVGAALRLPRLPPIDLRIVARSGLSPAAAALREVLESVVRERVVCPD
jgi:hypothetical protein